MPRKDPDLLAALTKREVEVLNLASEGKTSAQIGRNLGCAEGTVKKHLYNIYKKLKVRNRINAVIKFRWSKLPERSAKAKAGAFKSLRLE